MKQIIFYITILTVHFQSSAQMLEAGDGVVEVGVGFPNVKPYVYYPGSAIHSFDPFNFSDGHSYGQFIVKGEFFAADKIGFAAAFNYGYFTEYEEAVSSEYNPTTNTYVDHTYFYRSSIHKLRLLGGFNFHIVRTERADCYWGFMAGGKKVVVNSETNDPYATGAATSFQLPFIFRTHFGFRIFVTDYLALNAELGLGGPAISFGATYKF